MITVTHLDVSLHYSLRCQQHMNNKRLRDTFWAGLETVVKNLDIKTIRLTSIQRNQIDTLIENRGN